MHYGSNPWLVALVQSPTRALLATLAIVCFTVAGCDKVEGLVEDGKDLVNGGESTVANSPPVTTTPAQTQITHPETVVPAGPTPQQILEHFNGLQPSQISDGELAQLASSPEAAAAITEVDMHGARVSATGLSYLSKLPNLESLDASSTRIGEDSLVAIGQSQSLRSINLSNSDASDRVVGELSKIPHLQTLNLANTRISTDAARSLGEMRELTDLSLMGTATDQMVAGLTALPIRRLDLSRSQITNASLPILLQIPTLESLNVDWCPVTGDGFKGFGKSDIKKLSVSSTGFGTDGLVAIKGMKSLEDLNVFEARVQMQLQANVFRTFPKLRILNAGKNGLSDEALRVFFKGHKSLEELHLPNQNGITDNGLQWLIGLKNLKLLNVVDTSVRGPGAIELKKKLPECTIETSGGTL
ncbi:MAG: putative small secreted protein [Planctomycetaceae bacterium]|jgi:predicted small secreted protein